MTARAFIERRCRTVMGIAYTGMALFILAIVAVEAIGGPDWIWVPGLLGFAVAWLTMAGAYVVGIRCPYCRGRLTVLLQNPWRMGFRFCPYCGQDLDAECLNAEPQKNANDDHGAGAGA